MFWEDAMEGGRHGVGMDTGMLAGGCVWVWTWVYHVGVDVCEWAKEKK